MNQSETLAFQVEGSSCGTTVSSLPARGPKVALILCHNWNETAFASLVKHFRWFSQDTSLIFQYWSLDSISYRILQKFQPLLPLNILCHQLKPWGRPGDLNVLDQYFKILDSSLKNSQLRLDLVIWIEHLYTQQIDREKLNNLGVTYSS